MLEAFADRSRADQPQHKERKACCRIVTVQAIRNGLVSADAMLSSFAAAVYALQGAGRFCISVGFALRPIVAESLWTQA